MDDDVPLDVVNHITEMLRTEHNLKKKKKIQIPVAVVFTKIDAFFPTLDRGNPLMRRPRCCPPMRTRTGWPCTSTCWPCCTSGTPQDIDTHMRLNYTDFRYFGVSALGAEPDYETRTVAPAGCRPHRVEDPVLWLLSKRGTVRSA